ncbi:hypothetical protein TrLO_g40 [Triparma laevis f. longispina]|uniref:Nucleolar protein 58 n=1 Tax=Triparma laevis f. longispina TaxID=1714387 RepID=A0A9W7C589_9STRA|nr:hypothetical protein TrLO_g40 [Triparma laevis f. longispina]
MLVLFESPAGYGLFKCEDKVLEIEKDKIYGKYFEDSSKAAKKFKLEAFSAFSDTAEAVACATAAVEGSVGKKLAKFIKKNVSASDTLLIADKAQSEGLKEKVKMNIISNDLSLEIFRGIRHNMEDLMKDEVSSTDLKSMALGLSHSLSRYKLKFSPDKVDTMIVQAIGLLDELDKEINTYAMRVKEWYGWHMPELAKALPDNTHYAKLVLNVGLRTNIKNCDLNELFEQDNVDQSVIDNVKDLAEISMGTEISEMDIINIKSLAEQVLSMSEYRAQLSTYLDNRMQAIAPNLTQMVGVLVGARLIAHSGSLINLAKMPASTVQILGAEKALFRALKTKHDTPKYGLIYHASLIGQAQPKNKGKIARVLAAKTSLATRVDALSDDPSSEIGLASRAKVEARLAQLEGTVQAGGNGVTAAQTPTYVAPVNGGGHNDSSDMVGIEAKKAKKEKKEKKRKSEGGEATEPEKKKKKEKKEKKEKKSKA